MSGMSHGAVAVLEHHARQARSADGSAPAGTGVADRRAALDAAIEAARAGGSSALPGLVEIRRSWLEKLAGEGSRVYVPVVEHETHRASEEERHAYLRQLTVRITGPASGDSDEITTDVAVFGVEREENEFARRVSLAERAAFQGLKQSRARKGVAWHISFDHRYAFHAGESANLAIAALFHAARLRYMNQRQQFVLRSSAAVTGSVAEDGIVIPVEPQSLSTKVRAAFFSHVEVMVVPKEQMWIAEEEIRRLRNVYPRRGLDVVGVGHLRELFFDLRVIEQKKVPLVVHGGKVLWRHRYAVGAVALIGALLVILAGILYGPLDTNPVTGEYSGKDLIIRNSASEVIDRVAVGEFTVVWANKELQSSWAFKPVCFEDVDADGTREIFYIQKADGQEREQERIVSRRVGNRDIVWSVRLAKSLAFPRKVDFVGSAYSANELYSGDFDGDGVQEILTACNNQSSFPGLVLLLDARDGSWKTTYVHTGHVMDIVVADLDRDGQMEVLVCGINNALASAFLAVLDPRDMDGYSPTRDDYAPADIPRARERAYVLIPRTKVGMVFSGRSRANLAIMIEPMTGSGKLSVVVNDVAVSASAAGDAVIGHVRYYFDNDFRLLGADLSDDYDRLAAKLVAEGKLDAVPDKRYFDGFAREIRVLTRADAR